MLLCFVQHDGVCAPQTNAIRRQFPRKLCFFLAIDGKRGDPRDGACCVGAGCHPPLERCLRRLAFALVRTTCAITQVLTPIPLKAPQKTPSNINRADWDVSRFRTLSEPRPLSLRCPEFRRETFPSAPLSLLTVLRASPKMRFAEQRSPVRHFVQKCMIRGGWCAGGRCKAKRAAEPSRRDA